MIASHALTEWGEAARAQVDGYWREQDNRARVIKAPSRQAALRAAESLAKARPSASAGKGSASPHGGVSRPERPVPPWSLGKGEVQMRVTFSEAEWLTKMLEHMEENPDE